jgi:hypothetical protein
LLPIHEDTVSRSILKPVLGRKSQVLQTGSPQLQKMGEILGEPLSWFRHKAGQEKNLLLNGNGNQTGYHELK